MSQAAGNLLKMPSFPAFRPKIPILEAQMTQDERRSAARPGTSRKRHTGLEPPAATT